ncbi:MAG: DUF4432 family protein [Lentisphaerae bacterium]|nr:DUF4432 family protein [Lentisphaerota bacterium]
MSDFSRKNLFGRISSAEQLVLMRRTVTDDGCGIRLIEVNNGSGLSYTIYPERNMSIGECFVRGIGIVPRCGKIPDIYTGLFASAELAGYEFTELAGIEPFCGWRGESYVMEISGEIIHRAADGKMLHRHRTISTAMGKNILTIEERVGNPGGKDADFPCGFSINFSWPMINESVWLATAEHRITPLNEAAVSGMKDWCRIPEPQKDFAEEFFHHDLPMDRDGMAKIMLINPELKLAVSVKFAKAALPHLFQCKQMQENKYMLNLLPGNSLPPSLHCTSDFSAPVLVPGESTGYKVIISFEEL